MPHFFCKCTPFDALHDTLHTEFQARATTMTSLENRRVAPTQCHLKPLLNIGGQISDNLQYFSQKLFTLPLTSLNGYLPPITSKTRLSMSLHTLSYQTVENGVLCSDSVLNLLQQLLVKVTDFYLLFRNVDALEFL